MVLAQHPATAPQGVGVQLPGRLVVPHFGEDVGEVSSGREGAGVVVAVQAAAPGEGPRAVAPGQAVPSQCPVGGGAGGGGGAEGVLVVGAEGVGILPAFVQAGGPGLGLGGQARTSRGLPSWGYS
jgi:hypothetical protein